MSDKNWMKGAVKHSGALTAQAKAAGKSIDELCAQGSLDGTTKKRCVLAKTFAKFRKGKK